MKQMPSKQVFYELYNKNSPKNPKKKIGPVDAKLLLRDLSLPVAYSLAKIGVSANTVTVAFLIISLIGNTLFIIPSIYTLLVLIILGEFAQLLDCVDGQLARFHGTTSLYGRYFDKLSHELINGSFLFAFGIRVFLETQSPIFDFRRYRSFQRSFWTRFSHFKKYLFPSSMGYKSSYEIKDIPSVCLYLPRNCNRSKDIRNIFIAKFCDKSYSSKDTCRENKLCLNHHYYLFGKYYIPSVYHAESLKRY